MCIKYKNNYIIRFITNPINTINFVNTTVLYEKYSSTNSPDTTLMANTISETNRSI